MNTAAAISSDLIYLNNAATSWPKPDCVAQAVQQALISPPGAMHRGGLQDFDVFDAVRQELSSCLGVTKPSQIALGPNATWALNLAIQGFPYKEKAAALHAHGSHSDLVCPTVVTTKAEHNSVLRPLYDLEQRGIIHVIWLDTDKTGRVPLSIWQAAMEQYRPVLTVFAHASNVTGAVHDAAAMTAAAKQTGASVLIDASQTIGWLNLQAERWGADLVAFTGHKYLLGPQGTGGLWVRQGLVLDPLLKGGTGIRSDLDTMPSDMPLHLEAGTGNEPSFSGLLAALRWAKAHPRDPIITDAQLNRLRQGLAQAGASVIVPDGSCTPVVSFTLPNETAADAGFMLQESYDIVCRTGLHCAPKIFSCLQVPETIRLSLSRFTSEEEIETVISAVEDINT